jgi:TPR repeat protein
VGGVNYLLPVEASITSEATVPVEAVSLPAVMGIASGARRLALVVLDACRDNPLGNSMERSNGTRGATRGLAPVEPVGGNLLVAYATKDGHVASDGAGAHSPYTAAILEALKVPGLEVQLFWRKVHDSVLSTTSRAQEPFTYGALGAEALYLNPPVSAASGNPTLPLPPSPVSDRELVMWQSAQGIGTVEAYREYLAKYPDGQYSGLAKLAISSRPPSAAAPPTDTTLDAEAMNRRGDDYYFGRNGLSQSDLEAVHWYKKAAEQGYAAAEANLGWMYEEGRGGLAQSDTEAVRLYKKAAEQGYARGESNLGFMYQAGLGGLARNDEEAVRWFKMAAAQGDAAGEKNLGSMYEQGLGGLAQSDTEAVRLYKKAAEQGNATGEDYLADMYRDGRGGLPKSDAEAMKWYTKAARDGNKSSQDYLRSRGLSW